MAQPGRMLELSLAQRLRFKSVRQMKATLMGTELAEWLAYFKLEREEMERRRTENDLRQAALADLHSQRTR